MELLYWYQYAVGFEFDLLSLFLILLAGSVCARSWTCY